MFLKEITSDFERYFNSYSDPSFNDYGCSVLKAFNSHGIKFIEKSYDNDGLFIVIENKKMEIDLYTSICKEYSSYPIMKKNILRSIIEESSRGAIIPV